MIQECCFPSVGFPLDGFRAQKFCFPSDGFPPDGFQAQECSFPSDGFPPDVLPSDGIRGDAKQSTHTWRPSGLLLSVRRLSDPGMLLSVRSEDVCHAITDLDANHGLGSCVAKQSSHTGRSTSLAAVMPGLLVPHHLGDDVCHAICDQYPTWMSTTALEVLSPSRVPTLGDQSPWTQ